MIFKKLSLENEKYSVELEDLIKIKDKLYE